MSLLLASTGAAQASYGYRPYGAKDDQLTTGDTDSLTPLSPYRYTAKRFDTGSGTLDMGARRFSPSINRFLQLDLYQGALANLRLSIDPLTQNRYSLAAGNPISFVEVDGHEPMDPSLCYGDPDCEFLVNKHNWSEANEPNPQGPPSLLEVAHFALDAAGMVPGVGEIPDAVNALLYTLEGDYTNAAISVLAMAPVGGQAATASRYVIKHGDEVLGFVEAASRACSFDEDTLVATEDGPRAISSLRPGDRVLAWDEATGKTAFYTVTDTLAHTDPVVVRLAVGGEKLLTTPDHPFYVEERGWVPAGELRLGDRVRRAEGTSATVESVATEVRPQPMYNLTVGAAHTYFVGKGQWLVHNACPVRIARIAPGSLPSEEEAAVLQTLQHIDAGTNPVGPLKKKWGTKFQNVGGDLPGGQYPASPYREYRVAPAPGTIGPGARRIVADTTTGEIYYTWTHYGDSGFPPFVQVR